MYGDEKYGPPSVLSIQELPVADLRAGGGSNRTARLCDQSRRREKCRRRSTGIFALGEAELKSALIAAAKNAMHFIDIKFILAS
jgi:hypothetical protein